MSTFALKRTGWLTAAALLAAAPIAGHAYVLTNGTGDGDVTVDVDGFGFFEFAEFDPVGPIEAGSTVYESYVAITQGTFLTSLGNAEDSGATIISESDNQIVSQFTVNQLEFTLTQTVSDAVDGGVQTGSVFVQQFQIRNTTDVTNTFDLYRYMDGDLYLTDESLDDGGGVIQQGGVTVLYETDLVDGATAEDTFLGITAEGGTAPATGRFSITQCCDIQWPLDDDVFNDDNGDGVIDTAYDVTMTLRNQFSLAPQQVVTYTTATLFGNGEPPAPGSTESLALLPDRIENADGGDIPTFYFDIPVQDVQPGETIWIDPVIAVGYTYEITGAEFQSVTAPSLASVADLDGYQLSYDGNIFTLLAGETHTFLTPVTAFELLGIDTSLGLDPLNPLAFPLGVSLTNVAPQGGVTIAQTPITFDTDPSTPPTPGVPLPGPWALLLAGLPMMLLGGKRRRKH